MSVPVSVPESVRVWSRVSSGVPAGVPAGVCATARGQGRCRIGVLWSSARARVGLFAERLGRTTASTCTRADGSRRGPWPRNVTVPAQPVTTFPGRPRCARCRRTGAPPRGAPTGARHVEAVSSRTARAVPRTKPPGRKPQRGRGAHALRTGRRTSSAPSGRNSGSGSPILGVLDRGRGGPR